MKAIRWGVPLVAGMLFHVAAMGEDKVWTAHIAADGEVLRQWPQWITEVQHQPQDNYYSLYKLTLNPRIVQQDPGFCTVSPIDASNYERQMHGQAKVIGKPVAELFTVMTQLVDVEGASGDNSLELMVMCTR